MGHGGCTLACRVLLMFAAWLPGVGSSRDEIPINVILLQDDESPWSLNFVQGQILKAIETDSAINGAQGKKPTLTNMCIIIY